MSEAAAGFGASPVAGFAGAGAEAVAPKFILDGGGALSSFFLPHHLFCKRLAAGAGGGDGALSAGAAGNAAEGAVAAAAGAATLG